MLEAWHSVGGVAQCWRHGIVLEVWYSIGGVA